MARGDDQINVRLPPDQYAILAAAAYVRGLKSPSEVARSHLEALARELSEDRAIKMALEARALHEAEAEGRLSHLTRSRSAKAGPS
jgi:uncharacterized protein (DUF1778 family)